MPLLYRGSTSYGFSEKEMQDDVCEILKQELDITDDRRILTEIHNPDVRRISDIIIYYSKRKIFNIELKLDNVKAVMNQAIDHRKWANYSLICMPHHTYITRRDISKIVDEGLGLLLWQPSILFEVIFPKHVRHKSGTFECNTRAVNRLIKTIKTYPSDHGVQLEAKLYNGI